MSKFLCVTLVKGNKKLALNLVNKEIMSVEESEKHTKVTYAETRGIVTEYKRIHVKESRDSVLKKLGIAGLEVE